MLTQAQIELRSIIDEIGIERDCIRLKSGSGRGGDRDIYLESHPLPEEYKKLEND
jgi:hypothetical protein